MTETSASRLPVCSRCGKPAVLTCLACSKPVCGDCGIPAPGAATGFGDPTDTDLYFCSFRCEEIYIRIKKY